MARLGGFINRGGPSTFVTVVDTGDGGFRALTGLIEGTGRTVAIVGPSLSGKSEALGELRNHLLGLDCRVIDVAGSLRERTSTNALAQRIVDEFERGEASDDSAAERSGEPMAMAWAYAAPTSPGPSSRGRGRGWGRAEPIIRPEEFWTRWTADLRDPASVPLAICVDDAQLADSESRAFLGFLSRRARLRPLLVALAIDTSTPAASLWDEYLANRPDVDWIRRLYPRPDPRDVERARETLGALPPEGQQLVELTFLLGDSVGLPTIGRVSRLGREQLLRALKAPTTAGLLRVRDDRLTLASDALRPVLEELVPGTRRGEMHAAITDAFLALYPEPSSDQMGEIARHRFARAHDEDALRALEVAAARFEREGRLEEAADRLASAIACSLELSEGDRLAKEASLRVDYARLLIYTGRVEDAESEFQEGLGRALQAQLADDRLEELMESLLPALRLVGPRSVLVNELTELCVRFRDREAAAAEALAHSLLVDYELQRDRPEVAREEAIQTGRLVRLLPKGPAQAIGLLNVAAPILGGSDEERRVAGKCIHSAREMLGAFRRPELQLYTDEVYARSLLARGEARLALSVHDQAVHVAERARSLTYELIHRVALAGLLSEGRGDVRLRPSLVRARELCDRFALSGPATIALRLDLLEGRWQARAEHREESRESWASVAERRSPLVPNSLRAEAWVRLADLEIREGRIEEARTYLERLERPELRHGLTEEWASQLAELRHRAGRAEA